MTNIDILKETLSVPQNIVITMHQNPDGDAMGSSLGLYHFLKNKGYTATVISPTQIAAFLKWLPSAEIIIEAEKNLAAATKAIGEATLFFALDYNRLDRLKDIAEAARKSAAPKILIDHHLEPENFQMFMHWKTQASSTSELVYEFIEELNEEDRIDTTVATCLYAGILADTDRFRIPSTSAHVLRIAASLMDRGIQHTMIYEKLFESFSENRLRFFGHCLKDKLTIMAGSRVGIITVDAMDFYRYHLSSSDTEGLVNYPLMIDGMNVSVLITQRKEEVKLSFRSKGKIAVNEICAQHFNGGGHRNAAGGSSKESVEKTKEKLIAIFARLPLEWFNA